MATTTIYASAGLKPIMLADVLTYAEDKLAEIRAVAAEPDAEAACEKIRAIIDEMVPPGL